MAPARAEPPMQTQTITVQRSGALRVDSPVSQPGTVMLTWSGPIGPPMRDRIQVAFEAFQASRKRFVLVLNTGGGIVSEGERVIELLQRIRQTHRLDTAVPRGGVCGSMCIPVYLQGQTRYGARTSSWLFHEMTRRGERPFTMKKVPGKLTDHIEKYWIPAGVSRPWIERMLPLAEGHDYWQTGQELILDKAGIIMQPVENRSKRHLEPDELAVPTAQAPANPALKPGPGAETSAGTGREPVKQKERAR